ncbi:MAG: DUF1684 domain-containing protein [Chloroflexota bacterium]|nr:DUF1684 domain-containing protein [Lentimicrobium sp.]
MKAVKTLAFLLLAFTFSAKAQIKFPEYKKEILKERVEKNKEFINPDETPLAKEEIPNFKGLNYFKPNLKYRISAKLVRESSSDTIKMKTTTERLPLYLVYGKATFSLEGKQHTITIFRNIGLMTKPGYEDYLFVPFTDETSGKQSYGGGRYIDARITEGDSIILDFNKAYNPYCVYSKRYSCPIPPRENHINAKIFAGEKKYDH